MNFCKKCIKKAKILMDNFSPNSFKEKGVDVKIAVDLVIMARDNMFDLAILVSGDTDLVPAVEYVTKNNRLINAYFDFSSGKQLHDISTSTFRINKEMILKCIKN